ncbi:MAG: RNA polymerase sigma factor [Clostridia bacterium]|nr:RNA polymerase sigma factor [Clostridia bacterium]
MLYVAYKELGNVQDAEDAVQDALIRISSNIDSIDTSDSIRARNYVLIAAKNSARNIRRKNLRDQKIIPIDDAFDLSGGDTTLEIVEKSNFDSIVECINKLHPVYRDVLYYRCVEEMPEKEIANLLGRKYGTVKMQIKRGKEQLAALLEEKGVTSNEQTVSKQ